MKFIENKEAVSPVVGVMLMLVVTLIIAGVVSAFGGGLVSTTQPTPQASISSSLTVGSPLVLTHQGGDSIVGSSLDVKTKIISGYYVDMVSNVNLTESKLGRTNKAVSGDSFQAGDVLTVPWKDVFLTTKSGDTFVGYEPNKGDMVVITVLDKNSGKQISSQTVTVN